MSNNVTIQNFINAQMQNKDWVYNLEQLERNINAGLQGELLQRSDKSASHPFSCLRFWVDGIYNGIASQYQELKD